MNVQALLTECHPIHLRTRPQTLYKPTARSTKLYCWAIYLTHPTDYLSPVPSTALTKRNAGSLSRNTIFCLKKAWFIIIALQAKGRGSKLILHVTVTSCKSRAPQFRGIFAAWIFFLHFQQQQQKEVKGILHYFLRNWGAIKVFLTKVCKFKFCLRKNLAPQVLQWTRTSSLRKILGYLVPVPWWLPRWRVRHLKTMPRN